MKKKILVILAIATALSLTGCQYATKNLGGTTEITLDKNQKLQEITWKDDDLWILTREARYDEYSEDYKFYQKSDYKLEGAVVLHENIEEESRAE